MSYTEQETAEILMQYGTKVLELVKLLDPDYAGVEERERLAAAFELMTPSDIEGVALVAMLALARVRQNAAARQSSLFSVLGGI